MRPAGVIASVALFAATLLFPSSVPAAPTQAHTTSQYKGFNVRYGIAEDAAALDRLAGKSESFAVDVTKFQDKATGEQRAFGTGEAHGIYDAPIGAVAELLWNYPALKTVSPKLRDVKVEQRTEDSITVYEEIGINFLGIVIGYKLRLVSFRDNMSDGSIGLRYKLTESLDGKLYEADSSWYLKEVDIGGKKMLYMRQFSTSGMRKPGIGVVGAMKAFTAGELSSQIEAIANEARRLAGLQ